MGEVIPVFGLFEWYQFGLTGLDYKGSPDGVHLSRLGSLGAAEEMIEMFEKNPPSCGGAKKSGYPKASAYSIDAR